MASWGFSAGSNGSMSVLCARELGSRFFLAKDGGTEIDAVCVGMLVMNLGRYVGRLTTFWIEFVVDFFTDKF